MHHRSGGQEARRGAESVVGNPDAPRGVSSAAGDPGGRPCASARWRLRSRWPASPSTAPSWRRWSRRSGSIPIAEYATPSTSELPDAVRKYVKAHDGMLLANHGALTLGADLFSAYTRWRRSSTSRTSASSPGCSVVSGCCRRRRCCGCRGSAAGTASRHQRRFARIPLLGAAGESADCQVVFAPPSAAGERLVPGRPVPIGADEEIRLTYRELTALIEDAVKHLK